MRAARIGLVSLALVASSGCYSQLLIARGNPRPNIDLPASQHGLWLTFAPAVQDVFDLTDYSNGVEIWRWWFNGVHVTDWHETLANGFQNGLAPYFKQGQPSDLSLYLVEATPTLIPTKRARRLGYEGVTAQIRYRAQVRDRNGIVVARCKGTSNARRVAQTVDEVTMAVSSATEGMYEGIARDCFNRQVANARPW
jgi:hypothetical protein